MQPRGPSRNGPRCRGHCAGERAAARALRRRHDGRREAVPEGVPARRGRAVSAHDLHGIGGARNLGDGAVSDGRADRSTPPRDSVPLGPEATRARRAPHLRGDARLPRAAVPRKGPPGDLPRRRPGVGRASGGRGGGRALAERAAGAVRLLRRHGHRRAHRQRVVRGAHPDGHPEPAIGGAASRGPGLRDAGARHDRAAGRQPPADVLAGLGHTAGSHHHGGEGGNGRSGRTRVAGLSADQRAASRARPDPRPAPLPAAASARACRG